MRCLQAYQCLQGTDGGMGVGSGHGAVYGGDGAMKQVHTWDGLSTTCGMSLGQVKGNGAERVLNVLPAAKDPGRVTCPICLEKLAERVEQALVQQPGPYDHLHGDDLERFAESIGLMREYAVYEHDGMLRTRIEAAMAQGAHSG